MRAQALVVVPAGIALGLVALQAQIDTLGSPTDRALAQVLVAWAYLVAGLLAWSRRPANRLGILMVATGFALLLRQLRYSDDALAFTTFFLLGELGYALVGHSALAYPSGRVADRAERWLVRIGYATAIAFPFAVLLFYGATAPPPLFTFLPEESLLLITASADAVRGIHEAYVVVFFGVLATAFIALIVRRLAKATPRSRRMLAPLLLAAVAVALRAIFEVVFTFIDAPFAYDYLFWWQVLAFAALPGALLAGLVRSHFARATVGDLVVQLDKTPPDGIRDALAKGLGDPSLEVVFWLPERRTYVDRTGEPVELPAEESGRAVTRLEHGGEPLAALVHDSSLLDEPELIAAGAAAARLALENARLSAAVQAQLTTVKESRARIVAAGDEERRRIERDLHDGAQQRLVALALELRTAQRQLDAAGDPELDRVLSSAVGELQLAVDELRELARGVHPAILTEDGLAAALESLVMRTPIPSVLEEAPGQRFAPEVEATAYFVACEALANVVKHSGATKASVSAAVHGDRLVVAVVDDGVGGALSHNGSGLSGLQDRVEALGGRLRVESPAAGGTHVVGEIPCAS